MILDGYPPVGLAQVELFYVCWQVAGAIMIHQITFTALLFQDWFCTRLVTSNAHK